MKQPIPFRRYTQQTTPQSKPLRLQRDAVGGGLDQYVKPMALLAQGVQDTMEVDDELQKIDLAVEKLRVAREEDDAKVYASSAIAQAAAHASTVLREAPMQAPDGWRDLTRTVGDRFGEYEKNAIEQAPTPTARRFLEQRFQDLRLRTLDAASGLEQDNRRKYRADTIKGAIDTSSSVLAADPSRYDVSVAEQRTLINSLSDVTADERRGMLDYAETQFAGSAVAGMVERDPAATLRMLRDPEAEGPVSHLTGPQRLSLANQAQAELDRRSTQYRSAMRDRLGATLDFIKAGLPVENPPSVAEVRGALGADVARSYQLQLASSEQFSGLDPKPSGELVAIVTAAEPPASAGAAAIQDFRAKQVAARSILERRTTDPMGYAINRGLARDAGDLSAALGEFQQGRGFGLIQFLRTRSTDATEASRTLGVPPLALTKQEVGVVGAYVESLPPSRRAAFFQIAARGMSPEAYRTMVGEITPNNPANLFAAGAYARTGRSVPVAGGRRMTSEDVADLALQGDALLRPGAAVDAEPEQGQSGRSRTTTPGRFAMPSDQMLRDKWADVVGSAYRGIPEAEIMAYQTFRSVYAAMAAREGKIDGQMDGLLAQRAAQSVTGGVIDPNGDRSTLLPWGTDRATFEDQIERGWPTIASTYGLRGRWIDYDLVAQGNGWYAVMSGDTPARAADGRPVRINVGQAQR